MRPRRHLQKPEKRSATAGLAFGLAAQVAGPELLSEVGLGRFSAGLSFLRWPAVLMVLTAAMYLLYAVLPTPRDSGPPASCRRWQRTCGCAFAEVPEGTVRLRRPRKWQRILFAA